MQRDFEGGGGIFRAGLERRRPARRRSRASQERLGGRRERGGVWVRCAECGADPPGTETCKDRFYALLAAEQEYPEAAAMHGLFVLTWYAQHPSLCKPWLRAAQAETVREIFGRGRDWRDVLSWPEDRARRQEAVDRMKARHASDDASPAFGVPIAGEASVADLPTPGSPRFRSEYPAAVEAWAKSMAEHRFL